MMGMYNNRFIFFDPQRMDYSVVAFPEHSDSKVKDKRPPKKPSVPDEKEYLEKN